MSTKNIFDLVCGALPYGFDPTCLLEYGKAEWWRQNQFLACAYVLRNSSLFDWEAYFRENEDLRSKNEDHVLYFLRRGIFEGRKLYLKQANSQYKIDIPKVSVVLASYNSEQWLKTSISSLLNQSLNDIEIIIVDDASTDESIKTINEFVTSDNRIKVIINDQNSSLHVVRKRGVEAARGEYIMFLDADDYYLPYTCEIAYSYASLGYDIVTFGADVISHNKRSDADMHKMHSYLNQGTARLYRDNEIAEYMFIHNAPCRCVWNKIYASDICKQAFATMVNERLYSGQDVYEIAVLVSKSRTMLKIDDKLCVYRFGSGHTSTRDINIARRSAVNAAQVATPLKNFLTNAGLVRFYPVLIRDIYTRALNYFWSVPDHEDALAYFKAITKIHEPVKAICDIVTKDVKKIETVASQFNLRPYENYKKKIKSIGIVLVSMSFGGTEKVVQKMIQILLRAGYKVTVFIERPSKYDGMMLDNVNVAYYGAKDTQAMLYSINRSIILHKIDMMLMQSTWVPYLLQTIILFKLMSIKIICFVHESFVHKLYNITSHYTLHSFVSVMRCVHKVAVLSQYDELFYRQMGVNAQFIGNPVSYASSKNKDCRHFNERNNNIVFIGRLDDPVKRLSECLYILKYVLLKRPDVKMTFVGDFTDKKQEEKFIELAVRLNLLKTIRITGWVDDPTPFMDESAILISTSWAEGFGLSIAEAQASGLPVVMYEMLTAYSSDNPSIISIKQGDRKAAADEIAALLEDEARWLKLSKIAREKMHTFAPEVYREKILDMVENLDVKSNLAQYGASDYKAVISRIAFYGLQSPPWQ